MHTPERLEEWRQSQSFSGIATNQKEQIKKEHSANAQGYLSRIVDGEILIRPTQSTQVVFSTANLSFSQCRSCSGVSLWRKDVLLFPLVSIAIEPNEDLPVDIKRDFLEAREVLPISPRSAGALLRLCLQKLCIELGQSKDINEAIKKMVVNGLDVRIQKSLDIVRVIGNEAVHPGTLDLRDDQETVELMFGLLNKIAHDLVTHPREVDALFNALPPQKLDQIRKRDGSL